MNTPLICKICSNVLDDSNWNPSHRKSHYHICKRCYNKRLCLWRKANPEKAKAHNARAHHKNGGQPFDENKECTVFLGVHVAERVLIHVFKDVEVMPYGNQGYDFICNRGKKIDVKSSCQKKKGWEFHISHNTIADFFLCLAFDNREHLNPIHIWLIPGDEVNHLTTTAIRPSTLYRWDAYVIDISKIRDCCDAIRNI